MQCSIEKGTRFQIGGKVFVVASYQEHAKQLLYEDEKGVQRFLKESELYKLFQDGDLSFITNGDLVVRKTSTKRPDTLHPSKELEVAYRRLDYVKACLDGEEQIIHGDCKLARTINAHARSIDEKGNIPSTKTLRSWFYRWKSNGKGIDALIPRHTRKGNWGSPFSKEVLDLVWHQIGSFYLKQQKRSIKSLHESIVKAMNEDAEYDDEVRPSYATIVRIVNEIPEFTKVLHREGYTVAQRRFPLGLAVNEPGFVMAEVEIDHTPIDCEVVDRDTGEIIGRLWLTVVIEKITRVVIGFYIGRHAPSSQSVLLAIEHAIREKSYVEEKYPHIANDWPCWGLFFKMSVDNGPDLHAARIKTAMDNLGVVVHFNPPGNPQRKGRVERFNRTANAQVHELPGTTFSNYMAKGEYKSSKEACLGVEDVIEIFHIWLIDIYHQTPHRALGESPMSRWAKEKLQAGPPILPVNVEHIRRMFWTEDSRVINNYGIEYKRLRYTSPELMNISKRDGWKDLEVTMFIDHDDMSEIHVKDPKDGTLITVPCIYWQYIGDGLSLKEHEAVQKHLKDSGVKSGSHINESAYSAARVRIAAIAKAAKVATKKSRRKAELNKSQPSSATVAGQTVAKRKGRVKPSAETSVVLESVEFSDFEYEETLSDD